jgi:hypothetical protein
MLVSQCPWSPNDNMRDDNVHWLDTITITLIPTNIDTGIGTKLIRQIPWNQQTLLFDTIILFDWCDNILATIVGINMIIIIISSYPKYHLSGRSLNILILYILYSISVRLRVWGCWGWGRRWGCRCGWGRDREWVLVLIGAWFGPREQMSLGSNWRGSICLGSICHGIHFLLLIWWVIGLGPCTINQQSIFF